MPSGRSPYRHLLLLASVIADRPEGSVGPQLIEEFVRLWFKEGVDAKLLHERNQEDQES